MQSLHPTRVIQTRDLHAYFHEALRGAARQHRLRADAATHHYLTLMLSHFARSEQVFDFDRQRWHLRPLALLYGDALAANSEHERRLWLQRLGDLALFVGGLFAGRLSRRFCDLDYCMAMGGNAYAYLGGRRGGERGAADVFSELARDFPRFVDVVATVTGRQSPATR